MPALALHGLTKDYPAGWRGGHVRAVDQLSLCIAPGQIYGLLGPNGSGKSTTIKLLLGLLAPSAGSAAVFGLPAGSLAARALLGYLPESPEFPRHLSGRELVRFYARLCGQSGTELAKRVDATLVEVGLGDVADRYVGTYSKGMLQRIGLAQALVHDPRLVLLDEPISGVDPLGADAMAGLIRRLKAAGKTVLVTSHLLDRIEALCDRVAILDRGRLVLEGAVSDLTVSSARQHWETDALSAAERAELVEWLAARGCAVHAAGPVRVALEAVFRARIAGGQAAPEAAKGMS